MHGYASASYSTTHSATKPFGRYVHMHGFVLSVPLAKVLVHGLVCRLTAAAAVAHMETPATERKLVFATPANGGAVEALCEQGYVSMLMLQHIVGVHHTHEGVGAIA